MQGILYSAFHDDKLVVVTPSQGKTFPSYFPPYLDPKNGVLFIGTLLFSRKGGGESLFPFVSPNVENDKRFFRTSKNSFLLFSGAKIE